MNLVMEKGLPMREVTVKKSELLEKLRSNRTKHISEFNEACAGYKDAALAKIEDITSELKGRINRLKEGQMIQMMGISFGLDVPKSYEKVYDQAIVMMEMEVSETVKLRSDEFACYVMDDWDWKEAFTTSNSRYTNK